jgi:hypothetical protein
MDFKKNVIDKLIEFKQELKEYEKLKLANNEIKNIKKIIDQTNNEINNLDDITDINDDVKTRFDNIYTKEIPDLFVKLNDTLENIQKNGPIPRLNTTKNIPIGNIYKKIKSIINEKKVVYQNIDGISEIIQNADIEYKTFKFNYSLNDYIIFKENTTNDFTIGKIELIYNNKNRNDINADFTSIHVKYIEPMNILLNPGILYWVNIAEKKVADIFVNNYELITIEDQNYTVFPLQLFCDINDNIKTKLDEIFNIDDGMLLKLDYSNNSIQEQVNIKRYFNDSLAFYGILDDLIDEHFNRYIAISNNFNDFFKDKPLYKSDKTEIMQFLNDETSYDDNNVIGGSLEFKKKYLELVKKMPIKLLNTFINENQTDAPENVVSFSEIYDKSNVIKAQTNPQTVKPQKTQTNPPENEMSFSEIYDKPDTIQTQTKPPENEMAFSDINDKPDVVNAQTDTPENEMSFSDIYEKPDVVKTQTMRKTQRLNPTLNPLKSKLNKTQKRRDNERRVNELSLNP